MWQQWHDKQRLSQSCITRTTALLSNTVLCVASQHRVLKFCINLLGAQLRGPPMRQAKDAHQRPALSEGLVAPEQLQLFVQRPLVVAIPVVRGELLKPVISAGIHGGIR
jgi:hypothetical protein